MSVYRNRNLLDLAKQAPVCFGCMSPNQGDVVAAHANEGKALGMKNPDFMWAALDGRCHAALDQGKDMSREDRRAFWLQAYWRTTTWLWESGLICVAADPEPHVNEPKRPGKKIPKGRPIQSRGFPPGKRPFR